MSFYFLHQEFYYILLIKNADLIRNFNGQL